MKKRQKVQALVLGRRSLGEADRLVTFFTREAGLMRVLAKGVRKIPSRRGGHLEPLTRVLALVHFNHDFQYLAHVETLDYFLALRAEVSCMSHAQRVSQLLLQTVTESEPLPDLFDQVVRMWQTLPGLSFPKKVLLELDASLAILRTGGVTPSLTACQRCGRRVREEAVVLDGAEGGWHCLGCHGALAGAAHSLAPRLLKVLRFVATRPQEALRVRLDSEEGQQLLLAMQSGYAQ